MKVSAILSAIVLGVVLSSTASAAIVVDPVTPGVGVTVTGSGAKPNGPVELHQNGNSLGSLTANGAGTFSFTGLNVSPGDTFYATASQVWNFNTDGDFEGWASIGDDPGTRNVTGGIWTITCDGSSGVNMTLNLDPPGAAPAIIDTNLTRVFEMRYRTGGLFSPAASTVIYDPGSGFQFGPPFFFSGPTADFQTVSIDMTNGGINTYTSTGTSVQLAPGGNGFSIGDTWEIDYIRMTEYLSWEFNNDNDLQQWSASNGTITVAGGQATLINNVANTNVGIFQPFSQIDTAYYNTLETAIDASTAGPVNILFFEYFANGFSFAPGGHQKFWNPVGGTSVVTTLDLVGQPAAFGPGWTGIASLNLTTGYQPFFADAAGEVGLVDYIRLRPAVTFGPSATVTATAGPSINDGVNIY